MKIPKSEPRPLRKNFLRRTTEVEVEDPRETAGHSLSATDLELLITDEKKR
jgi:hypothetical protein